MHPFTQSLAVVLVFAGSALCGASPASADLSYSGFSSYSGLQLVGSTALTGGRLRLTPAAGTSWVSGGVWSGTKQQVQAGFSTTFQFQITEPDAALGGGDGFAFVIQNAGPSALGTAGRGLGYGGGDAASGGIANSIAVEFDTYKNAGDPNDNHISVHTRGTFANSDDERYSLGSTTSIPRLKDGAVHTARVAYAPGSLSVFVDGSSNAALTVSVDLGTMLNLDAGSAYVGFTSSVATARENHDLLAWNYTAQPPAAPSGLRVNSTTPSEIDLGWTDNSGNEDLFEIERRDGTSPYRLVGTVGANVTTFADRGLPPSTGFSYRVRARNPVGTSGYSNEVAAATSGIRITEARMVSSHEFRVTTAQTSAASGTVTVSCAFPAVPPKPVPAGSSQTVFVFDLAKARVPRFSATQRLQVAASLMHGGSTDATAAQTAIIPLPVVTVHGIQLQTPGSDRPMWGHFPGLENALVAASSNGPYTDAFGAYQRFQDDQLNRRALYPTLFAFTWSSDGSTLNSGAQDLGNYLRTNVAPTTWAAKVILLGHSRGANLCRYFITSTADPHRTDHPFCAGAILACDPAVGAVPAIHLGRALGSRALPTLGALDLLPTWPWHRDLFLQQFSATDNTELKNLNRWARPKGLPMIALYGYDPDVMNTANTFTARPPLFTFTRGDGYVTIYSAQGLVVKPRKDGTFDEPSSADQIPWFAGPTPMPVRGFRISGDFGIYGLHSAFLEQSDVQQVIYQWLGQNAYQAH